MKQFVSCVIIGVLLAAAVAFAAGASVSSLRLVLRNQTVLSGTFVEGTVFANATASLDPDQFFTATLGDSTFKKKLVDVFVAEGIRYNLSGATYQAVNPSATKTLAFSSAGAGRFYVKLPRGATVQDVQMGIRGMQYSNSSNYPSFVTFDVGDDGKKEWSYYGGFDSYLNYTLPAGLAENSPGGTSFLNDQEYYYCEIINLPESRDFEVSAQYKNVRSDGDIFAVIFSLNRVNGVNGQGGAERCDLPEGGSTMEYHSCTLSAPVFIKGERLVCIFNNATHPSPDKLDRYEIQRDTDAGNGYTCNPLISGTTSCTAMSTDYFIKIRAANYTGALVGQTPFSDWFTEYNFTTAFTTSVKNCPSSGDCVVPVVVGSQGAGAVYLDNLQVRYSEGLFGNSVEQSFYDATTQGGEITTVNGRSASSGVNFNFSLRTLGVLAPSISTQSKNYSLDVKVGGTSVSTRATVTITTPPSVVEALDPVEVIDAYTDVLTLVSAAAPGLLTALGLQQDVQDGLTALSTFTYRASTINASTNMTAVEKTTAYDTLLTDVDAAMKDLPKSIIVTKSVTDSVIVGVDDITDMVVLPTQRTADAKNKIYAYQNKFTVSAAAQFYTVTYFSGGTDSGTYIEKTVSGSGTNVNVVEVIPASVASNDAAIQFGGAPQILRSASPVIASWLASSVSGQKISYTVEGDQVADLPLLKTILVPQVLPSESAQPVSGGISYSCGDGACSYFETDDGEKIPLETSLTCPQDCKKKISWTPFIIALLIVLAIVYYLNFYHGKYTYRELLTHLKKTSDTGKEKTTKQAFISQTDQQNLMTYVRTSMDRGFTKQQITKTLLDKGWRPEQVDQIFQLLKK